MPHQKSSDYKETAVQYYLVEDKSQEEVCKIFKCSRRSLMRWVDKYKKYGKITGYERTPKAYKVHKEHVDFLLQEIKQNKTITIEDLLLLLKNKYPDVELKENIINTITNIPKDKYRNIIKGAYEGLEKYVSNKNKTRKIKKNYL